MARVALRAAEWWCAALLNGGVPRCGYWVVLCRAARFGSEWRCAALPNGALPFS